MQSVTKRFGYTLVLLGLLSLGLPAFGQQGALVDEGTLIRLFESSLRYPGDTYLEKRIADERTRIRSIFEKDVQSVIDALVSATTDGEGTDLPKALDRQRNLVSTLEERLQEQQVDLDLLSEEEKKYYLAPIAGTGSLEDYRLTRS